VLWAVSAWVCLCIRTVPPLALIFGHSGHRDIRVENPWSRRSGFCLIAASRTSNNVRPCGRRVLLCYVHDLKKQKSLRMPLKSPCAVLLTKQCHSYQSFLLRPYSFPPKIDEYALEKIPRINPGPPVDVPELALDAAELPEASRESYVSPESSV